MNSKINKKTASDVGFEVVKVDNDIFQHADFQQTTRCYILEKKDQQKENWWSQPAFNRTRDSTA